MTKGIQLVVVNMAIYPSLLASQSNVFKYFIFLQTYNSCTPRDVGHNYFRLLYALGDRSFHSLSMIGDGHLFGMQFSIITPFTS